MYADFDNIPAKFARTVPSAQLADLARQRESHLRTVRAEKIPKYG